MELGKFKIWEVLLFVAVVLLGAIAYETHKSNAQGRYQMVGSPWEMFDTKTGDFWTRKYAVDQVIGEDTSYVYQWQLFTRGPYDAERDTISIRRLGFSR